MIYFFNALGKLEKIIGKNDIFLFLDYDGTLAPIRDKPNQAFISKKTKDLLGRLAKTSNCKVAVISGRSLKDVKNKVGIRNIIYAGNHGLEMQGPGIKLKRRVDSKFRKVLRLIKVELTKRLSGVKGVFVEDKGLTLCLHYRLVGTKYIPEVKNIFRKIVGHHPISGKIRVESGKMMLEVRPAINWDKGKIVLWLLAKQRLLNKAKILPLYIGDDITDEDAFRAIRKKGITVFVGSPRRSYAKYYVKSPREVVKLLKTFTVLRPFAPLRCKNKS